MKVRILPLVTLLVALVAPVAIQGCSSHSETTTTRQETTTANPPPATTTTTTTTTTKDDEPDSVLEATFHAIATIVLFPFRLVGDAIGLLV